jgi:hypothetical protein
LAQNNSKAIFEALSDLLVTGYTGTNVNGILSLFPPSPLHPEPELRILKLFQT